MESLLREFNEIAENKEGLSEILSKRIKAAEDPAARAAQLLKILTEEKADTIVEFSEYFVSIDTDGSGFIDKEEARIQCSALNKEHCVAPLFEQMDADGDERISKEEFISYFVKLFDEAIATVESTMA